MGIIQVAVINQSLVVKDEEIKRKLLAFQKQVHEHFATVWGTDAELRIVPTEEDARDAWWLVITDDADQDAWGHHDPHGTPQGNPLAKVFAKRILSCGQPWTITASHELLEMLVNPHDNRMVLQLDKGVEKFWDQEVCDPCEIKKYAYQIDGIWVSDFVFPSWFELFYDPEDPIFYKPDNAIRYDHEGKIDKPFEVLEGGEARMYTVGGWTRFKA